MLGSRHNVHRFLSVVSVLFAVSLGAQPAMRVIDSEPLTINIAADGSFQVFNSTVPGTGQIFPSSSQYGDAGIFADINGTLFAPAFSTRGTATGGLGQYTAWTQVGMSEISGTGTRGSPYTVTLQLSGGGVTLEHRYEYVAGDNYFRMFSNFTGPDTARVNVFIGADIYLSASDAGRFFYEETLQAPGGRDCGTPPTYNILIIPLTPAQHFAANGYSNIWNQIGGNSLDDSAVEGSCVDNGAAVMWSDIFGLNTTNIESAVSFGGIPVIIDTAGFSIQMTPDLVTLLPGQSATFDITTIHNEEIEFNSPLTLFTAGIPTGMTATLDATSIPAPGSGTAKMTVQVSPDMFPMTYRGLAVHAVADNTGESHGTSVTVDVVCDPPFVTALNAPQSQYVARGTQATLRVQPEGEGVFTYEWYRGFTGMTGSPVADANRNEITTDPVTEPAFYWVRVRNACGSIDTRAALVSPSN